MNENEDNNNNNENTQPDELYNFVETDNWGWEVDIDIGETDLNSLQVRSIDSPAVITQKDIRISLKPTLSKGFHGSMDSNDSSLISRVKSSSSFQELERAIGATLAVGLSDTDLSKKDEHVKLINGVISQKATLKKNIQQRSYNSLRKAEIDIQRSYDIRNDLKPYLNETESRALLIFHSTDVISFDIRAVCQSFGSLYYFRSDFHSLGLTLVCYFDLRCALDAYRLLSSRLGRLAAATTYYSVILQATNNSDESQLKVCNIPANISEILIQDTFSQYGQLKSIQKSFIDLGIPSSSTPLPSLCNYIIEYFNLQDAKLAMSEINSNFTTENNVLPSNLLAISITSPLLPVPYDRHQEQTRKELLNLLSIWRQRLNSTSTQPDNNLIENSTSSILQTPIPVKASKSGHDQAVAINSPGVTVIYPDHQPVSTPPISNTNYIKPTPPLNVNPSPEISGRDIAPTSNGLIVAEVAKYGLNTESAEARVSRHVIEAQTNLSNNTNNNNNNNVNVNVNNVVNNNGNSNGNGNHNNVNNYNNNGNHNHNSRQNQQPLPASTPHVSSNNNINVVNQNNNYNNSQLQNNNNNNATTTTTNTYPYQFHPQVFQSGFVQPSYYDPNLGIFPGYPLPLTQIPIQNSPNIVAATSSNQNILSNSNDQQTQQNQAQVQQQQTQSTMGLYPAPPPGQFGLLTPQYSTILVPSPYLGGMPVPLTVVSPFASPHGSYENLYALGMNYDNSEIWNNINNGNNNSHNNNNNGNNSQHIHSPTSHLHQSPNKIRNHHQQYHKQRQQQQQIQLQQQQQQQQQQQMQLQQQQQQYQYGFSGQYDPSMYVMDNIEQESQMYQKNPITNRPPHHNGGHTAVKRSKAPTSPTTASAQVQDSEYHLSPEIILSGGDKRTTIMIRNIPNKYSQSMLLEEINNKFDGLYDFFYLPIDFKNKCNVGYAFVNFMDPNDVIPFFHEFNGQKWRNFNSEKVCQITYARIQGKAAMIARFQNSSLLEKDDSYKPLLFVSKGPEKGKPELFPNTRLATNHSHLLTYGPATSNILNYST